MPKPGLRSHHPDERFFHCCPHCRRKLSDQGTFTCEQCGESAGVEWAFFLCRPCFAAYTTAFNHRPQVSLLHRNRLHLNLVVLAGLTTAAMLISALVPQ